MHSDKVRNLLLCTPQQKQRNFRDCKAPFFICWKRCLEQDTEGYQWVLEAAELICFFRCMRMCPWFASSSEGKKVECDA